MKLHKAWGSHLPVLIKLVEITDGNILELGSGIFSTPYLHWACLPTKRQLTSYDHSPQYSDYLKQYEDPEFHEVIHVDDYDDAMIEKHWDIAFFDHAPEARRKVDIARLANLAKYLVIHDSDPKTDGHYRYSEIYPLFKYRYDYTAVSPNTTILSNFVDLTDFHI